MGSTPSEPTSHVWIVREWDISNLWYHDALFPVRFQFFPSAMTSHASYAGKLIFFVEQHRTPKVCYSFSLSLFIATTSHARSAGLLCTLRRANVIHSQ